MKRLTVRVFLDSCVIVYLIEGAIGVTERVRHRLRPGGRPAPIVVFTDLSRLECRVKPLAEELASLLNDYDAFFSTPGFIKADMDATVFDLATERRARGGLKTADALHLAAAVASGCDEIRTNDNRLGRVASGHLRAVAI